MTSLQCCFFILVFVHTIPVAISIRSAEVAEEEMGGVSDFYCGERIKRAALSLIAALLKTARLRSKSNFSKVYEKRGGYDQALLDFKRLQPTKQIQRGTSRSGHIYGLEVELSKHADKTTLNIYQRVFKPHRKVLFFVDRIEYTD